MQKSTLAKLGLVSFGLLVACSSPQGVIGADAGSAPLDATALPSNGLPCNVSNVLTRNCQSCHGASPQFGAPQSLVSYEDLVSVRAGTRVVDQVLARMKDDARPMPPGPNARVGVSDQAIIASWVSRGANRSTEVCGDVKPPPDAGVNVACTTDQFIRPTSAWTMPAGVVDQYVCYGIDIAVGQKRHITALAPKVVNSKIVHHVLLVETTQMQPSTPYACSSSSGSLGRLVYAWAPGGGALELPVEAGLPLEGTKHYLVQLHYNNASGAAGETDSSGFDLCTTSSLRPNDADVVAFGTTSFSIPPNPAGGAYPRTCSLTLPKNFEGLHFFGAMPHMHQLGLKIATKLVRAGVEIDLGTTPSWNFDAQYWLPISAVSQANDAIVTSCSWKNDTGREVKFGSGTADEMCYSFTMYYPRIPSLPSWEVPARLSRCN
jgi:Copper type II ascorbate-dependent monooxygenase, C-terminal domain/Copper type II ascorbate-dependent monooxygenase, N-terminal domain